MKISIFFIALLAVYARAFPESSVDSKEKSTRLGVVVVDNKIPISSVEEQKQSKRSLPFHHEELGHLPAVSHEHHVISQPSAPVFSHSHSVLPAAGPVISHHESYLPAPSPPILHHQEPCPHDLSPAISHPEPLLSHGPVISHSPAIVSHSPAIISHGPAFGGSGPAVLSHGPAIGGPPSSTIISHGSHPGAGLYTEAIASNPLSFGSGYAPAFGGNGCGSPDPAPLPPVIHQHSEVTRHVPVPVVHTVRVPQPVPYPVSHPVPVHVPHPVPVEVRVPVQVPHPVPYEVRVPVIRNVPYPVEKPVPYPVERPYPVRVIQKVPVPIPRPYPVHVPVYKVKHIYHHEGRWQDDCQ